MDKSIKVELDIVKVGVWLSSKKYFEDKMVLGMSWMWWVVVTLGIQIYSTFKIL